MIQDRHYQTRTYQRIRESYARGNRRILLVSPTGSGKSVMSATLMQAASEKGRKSIFFADQRELVTQLADKLEKLGHPCGITLAGHRQEYFSGEEAHLAMVCRAVSKDTIWARRNRDGFPSADVVHVDEAHRSMSRTWQEILYRFEDACILGWTATPCRSDGQGLGDFYQDMIEVASYEELQEGGWLVPTRVIAPDSPDLKGVKVSQGDYAKGELQKRMNKDEMVGCIISEWKLNAEDRQTVVFASGIEHSLHIMSEFRHAGITCEHLDGKTETTERHDILGRIADGTTRVLCNFGVATTGLDVPALKYMVCARPTKSFGLWRQMGGRLQRPYEGHDHCMIQDHSDNACVFGFPDEDVEWTLDAKRGSRPAKKKPKKPKEKQEITFKCPNPECRAEYKGKVCPKCGYTNKRRAQAVDMQDGKLTELDRKNADSPAKRNRTHTREQKSKAFDEFLGWAIGTNRPVGAASKRYRDVYGVWPRRQSGVEFAPQGRECQMMARDFYNEVVLPMKHGTRASGDAT